MANPHAMPVDAQNGADFAEHEKTYQLFLTLLKFGLIGVLAVLVILAFVTL
jgi:hypothetical protein